MTNSIDCYPLSKFQERYPDRKLFAYALDFKNKIKFSFGFLYVEQGYYTIAWDGFIDFSTLETAALVSLPTILHETRKIPNLKEAKSVFNIKAHLIVDGDETQLIQCELGYKKSPPEYNKFLSQPKKIKFARYDVVDIMPSSTFSYSISAENPFDRHTQHEYKEVAVRQPIDQPITELFLDWIIRRHSANPQYEGKVSLEKSVSKIWKCVLSNSNH